MKTNQKIRSYLSKIEHSLTLKLSICVVLCLLVIIVVSIMNNVIELRNFRKYTLEDDVNLINSVESIQLDDDNLRLEGYAFILDKDSSNNVISIFLRNVVTEEEIWLDMEQVNRLDVDLYYNGGYNYKNSGFIALKEEKTLDIDAVYEIIINIDYYEKNNTNKTRKTVSGNRYILNGNLYSYNPIYFDISSINVKSDLLKEVFLNGELCLYQKEEGMYVYKYEDKLYWIATDYFKFEDNKRTHIIYQLYTSQVDKLPERRIQYKFDNLDFNFEDYENVDENTAPYRVAIRDIPKEYVITYIKTGVFNREVKKSYWKKSFHLKGLNN